MGELAAWAKKNSKTLILDDGETVEAEYQGHKITVSPFDPEKEIVLYKLKIDTLDGPQVKAFKSASGHAARFFDELLLGIKVKITRHGKGTETKYEFSVIGSDQHEEAGEHEEELSF